MAPYIFGACAVLVITPSKQITQQLVESCSFGTNNFFYKIGLLSSDHLACLTQAPLVIESTSDIECLNYLKDQPLVITNAHKFSSSRIDLGKIPSDAFDMVIVDEAHHFRAKTWRKIVLHFPQAY
jgi:superfamily II DNA or RNA helicase